MGSWIMNPSDQPSEFWIFSSSILHCYQTERKAWQVSTAKRHTHLWNYTAYISNNAFKPHIIRLYIIKYSRYRLLCLSVPNAAAWTDHFIPSIMQYLPCLPSQLLSSLVVYLHYSKITYLLVKTAVIFLPIRFYFQLHSGLYLSILSSNLPPESWCNNSLQSERWNRLRPQMK